MTFAAPPRIALVHAVDAAIAPVAAAFRRHWPDAVLHNLVDDRLAPDLEQAGALTPALHARIRALAELGVRAGAAGVLFTCSAFAEAIEAAAQDAPVPVLKPDEAMFDEALQRGVRIGMLATFAPAVASMERAFQRHARARQCDAALRTVCLPDALAALRRGDTAGHDRLVAQALPHLADCDVVLLAHFSTSTALEACRHATRQPLLSAPDAAVLLLQRLTGGTRPA
jgi:hypothetical protein